MRPALAPERFLIQRWADGIVVFDRLLGDTHTMNTATAALFERLLAQPQQLPDVAVAQLAAEQGSSPALWADSLAQLGNSGLLPRH